MLINDFKPIEQNIGEKLAERAKYKQYGEKLTEILVEIWP